MHVLGVIPVDLGGCVGRGLWFCQPVALLIFSVFSLDALWSINQVARNLALSLIKNQYNLD